MPHVAVGSSSLLPPAKRRADLCPPFEPPPVHVLHHVPSELRDVPPIVAALYVPPEDTDGEGSGTDGEGGGCETGGVAQVKSGRKRAKRAQAPTPRLGPVAPPLAADEQEVGSDGSVAGYNMQEEDAGWQGAGEGSSIGGDEEELPVEEVEMGQEREEVELGHGVEREQQVVVVQEVHDEDEQGDDDGHAFDVSFDDIVQMPTTVAEPAEQEGASTSQMPTTVAVRQEGAGTRASPSSSVFTCGTNAFVSHAPH